MKPERAGFLDPNPTTNLEGCKGVKMFKLGKAAVFTAGLLVSVSLFTAGASAASYTVATNDSLYKVGVLFNSSASTIKSDNGLTGNVIYPGQVLSVRARTYTVKSGDSLYLIAKKFGISLYSLRKANNKWNDYITPGQVLVIPGTSVSGTSTTGSTSTTGGSTSTGSAVISYSQSDLDLLARLITAEADGEPYNAQVGVGAVVINRIQSGQFPKTIASVIYQKDEYFYQFTPVENGYINKPATETAKRAAYDALHGADPSKGALFYFDDSATNKWLWSKPIYAYIGHMVFVK